MKTEFLKGLGLTDEQISSIMKENGIDVENEKAKTKKAEDDLRDAKDSITNLTNDLQKLKDTNASAEDWKKKFEDLQKTNSDREQKEKEEREDALLTAKIEEVFGDKKFTSDYVRNGIIADMKAEISKEENKGKGYAEIFNAITKDKDGIFKNPNPPADMNAMGDVNTEDIAKANSNTLSGALKEFYSENKKG